LQEMQIIILLFQFW